MSKRFLLVLCALFYSCLLLAQQTTVLAPAGSPFGWYCRSDLRCGGCPVHNPKKHQRYDYGAGVEGNRFYMFSGGFKRLNNIAPGDILERKAGGVPPAIDFASLPGW